MGDQSQTRTVETVLWSENLEAVKELLDEGDGEEAELLVRQLDAQRAARNRAAQSTGRREQSKRRPLLKAPVAAGWTLDQMRQMAPPGDILFLQEERWHTRWRCKHLDCPPPNNMSRVFHTSHDELAAQKACLRFLWSCHCRLHPGTEVPWLLD